MKKVFWSLMILCMGIILIDGCKKEDNNATAPDLPPLASMQSNFSSFGGQKSASSEIPYKAAIDTLSSTNFIYAALNVGVWNTIIGVTLAVPVAAFAHSFKNQPSFINNSTWQWKYTYPVLGGTYNARLTGQVQSDSVKWEMYISKSGIGAFSELKWFEGNSSMDGTGGQWLLYYSVAHPDPFLHINWTRSGDSVEYAKYTIVRDSTDSGSVNPAKGSYVEAGYQSGDYDAYYNIHVYNATSTNFDDVNIEWSTTQYFGHVKSENFYNDANWHCWDSTGVNIVCN